MPTIYTLRVGNEEFDLEGPDNATDEQLQVAARDYLKTAKPKEQFPPSDVIRQPAEEKPESFLQGVGEGAMHVVNNAAAYADKGLNKLGIDLSGAGEMVGLPSREQTDANVKGYFDSLPTQGSEPGRFVGESVGTALLTRGIGGPLTQGAIGGALLSDAQDASGVLKDAAIGGVAGRVGQGVVNAASRTIAPAVNANVRRLIDAGVPLTPGQIVGQNGFAGRAVKRVEDSVSNLPIVGTAIRGARARGDDALNRAATNRALNPIGERLPATVETGHEAVAFAGDRLRDAYGQLLPTLSGTIDNQFARRVSAIRQRANLPADYDAQLDQAMGELANAFTRNGQNGQFSGRTLRDASDRLDKLSTVWRANPNDPYLREVGEVAGQLREQLHALARRQNPQAAARLRDIDRGYASLVRVERAAAGTDDGIFTARGYKTATRQSDRSVRKRESARGQALDQDLSSAAAQVMPSNVGEGGSNAVNGLGMLGALGVGAYGGSAGSLAALGTVAASPLLYTRPAQATAQWILGRQASPSAQYLADLVRRGAQIAGNAATVASGPITSSSNR